MFRDTRARILRDGADDSAFTTLDKDIGNCFAKDRALCDCVKMALTLGACAERDIVIAKHIRLTENRACHGYFVVECEHSNQGCGGIRRLRDMSGELSARF